MGGKSADVIVLIAFILFIIVLLVFKKKNGLYVAGVKNTKPRAS
jgi:hypothetical protein